jgi:hypothetical protein
MDEKFEKHEETAIGREKQESHRICLLLLTPKRNKEKIK